MNFRDPSLNEADVRLALDLRPHPEGGHYREVWRDLGENGGRGSVSSILFLLAAGERSHWHRIDAVEIWTWLAGSALLLQLYESDTVRDLKLGPSADHGETFQGVVGAGVWQGASSLGGWSLVTCIVAPAFQFGGFELAPPGGLSMV